jgi:hypothetical protein
MLISLRRFGLTLIAIGVLSLLLGLMEALMPRSVSSCLGLVIGNLALALSR